MRQVYLVFHSPPPPLTPSCPADCCRESFDTVSAQLLAISPDKTFDQERIFYKMNLFTKRLRKLIELFSAVMSFSALEEHTHISGLEGIVAAFYKILDDVKRKPYDLLNFAATQFDRDHLEFNVNIHDMEANLQEFVHKAFEAIVSVDHALSMLHLFQSVFQMESVHRVLEAKYLLIFQRYGKDLENVQKMYEKHKYKPPVPRNAPPVAGNIMWARQLLRRIELPMQRFAQNRALLSSSKETKKIVKTYNKVAKALIEFETLWHQAWLQSIETCKKGLDASLLVQHPETGNLLVNFDKEIIKLIRETKYLQLCGVQVCARAGARAVYEPLRMWQWLCSSLMRRQHASCCLPSVFLPSSRSNARCRCINLSNPQPLYPA